MAGRSAEGGGGGRSAEGGEGGGGGHTLEAFQYFLKTRKPEPRAARWGQWQRSEGGGDNGRGVKAVSGGGSEGDGGDDVEWLGEALRAVGVDEALRAVGAVRAGTHWKLLNTSKGLENPNQGQPGETMAETEPRARWGQWQRSEGGDGGGREGGEDVEWVGSQVGTKAETEPRAAR